MLRRELVVVQEPLELAPAPGEQRQPAGQHRRGQRRDRGVRGPAGPAPAEIEAIPGDREEVEVVHGGIGEKLSRPKQSINHEGNVNDQKSRDRGEQTQVESVGENERDVEQQAEVDDCPLR